MESASPHCHLWMLEGQAGRRTLKSSKTAVFKLSDAVWKCFLVPYGAQWPLWPCPRYTWEASGKLCRPSGEDVGDVRLGMHSAYSATVTKGYPRLPTVPKVPRHYKSWNLGCSYISLHAVLWAWMHSMQFFNSLSSSQELHSVCFFYKKKYL